MIARYVPWTEDEKLVVANAILACLRLRQIAALLPDRDAASVQNMVCRLRVSGVMPERNVTRRPRRHPLGVETDMRQRAEWPANLRYERIVPPKLPGEIAVSIPRRPATSNRSLMGCAAAVCAAC